MKNIKDSELKKILDEVEQDLAGVVTLAKSLEKSHPGEETTPEVPSDTSATAPSDSAPGDTSPPSDPSVPATADASVPPAPSPDASATIPDPGADPGAEVPPDPAVLQAEFANMPVESLKVWYIAIKSALFAATAPPPDASAPPTADPGSSPPALPTAKAEINTSDEANGGGIKLMRSELETFKGRLAKSDAAVVELTGVIEKLLQGAASGSPIPRRVAFTGASQVPAAKPPAPDLKGLTKSEVVARLRPVIRTNLSKSDRELINRYDANEVGVDKIAHLLK